ncbi:phosphoethanolamine transferase [Dysgonomonas sp. Marseille-P4677]|uniref:phosphoethanolamine transferase n=1 Tax=Dysgonomonas sp. Marseille-P4677 TaxID=2364790 RepID=UPI0019123A5C|nr:phosphoethanolamine transferase [Dysgonomonas sp. Marseille-P4677]MBK5721677.1 phosphoethanolamine transferase [Dysgonomonas sp. Marseille-P4677]
MELKKHLDGFITSPKKLFILLIIVNIIPNVGLVFTEPLTSMGKLLLILFPLGVYCIVFTISKNIGLIQLLLFPLLVLHAFQIVVFYLFGEDVIAVDMFLNVVTTNMTEAGEVLNSIIASVVFVIVIYIPTIIIAFLATKRKVFMDGAIRKKIFFSGIAILIFSYALSYTAKNKDTNTFTLHQDVYPVNVLYNLDFAIHKWKRSSQYQETSRDFTFNAYKEKNADEREIYVLIIGETSRAENWGLYGYERNTTPHLSQDSNIVFFKDAITQSNTTHKSVPIIMSTASAEDYNIIYHQKSIIEAFKEVGFTTVFISNQSANHTFTDYFAQEADYLEYYRHFNDKTNNLDEILLPKLKHYIDSISGNLFVVLHTYGSHFNYKERYPEDFAVFTPDNIKEIKRSEKDVLVNAYDNTILYTDHFLHTVLQLLTETGACSSLFYASDHGEDILDDNRERFLHASPNPTFYQLKIPMFIWFSDQYKENYPVDVINAINNSTKPVATNAAFHTILDMAHIYSNYFDTDLSLVSKNFKIKKRMYLNDHDEPIFFYNAGLKKEDKIMIEKRKMYY